MLTWPHLRIIANEVYRVFRQLLEEALRLENERRSVNEFRRAEALVRALPLSDRLNATFWDGLHVFRRRAISKQEESEAEVQSIDLEYQAVAEIREDAKSENDRVVKFHFTTVWSGLDLRVASPEARVAAQRELRKVDSVLRKILTAWPTWDEQQRAAITANALPALEMRNVLLTALWPHQLRTSRKVKAALWRWRSSQTELTSHGLGPIVLSPKTTLDEVCLKMALLAARSNILDEQELDVTLRQMERYLRTDFNSAQEVFSRATMGYVGDLSPDSFRTYLCAVLMSSWARENRITNADAGEPTNGVYRELPPRHGRRSSDIGDDKEGEPRRATRRYIRLPGPELESHPWAADEPALLARLAVDYRVEAHVARSWWRAGKISARGCRRREEWTASGQRITGTLEVSASERGIWETLCASYRDKQARRELSPEGTATEKKRLYRTASRAGGSREKAALVVRQCARAAGLPDRHVYRRLRPTVPPEGVEPSRVRSRGTASTQSR
jgi:hypothetical protein